MPESERPHASAPSEVITIFATMLSGSLMPSLRSSKDEGQAEFVNPGIFLANAGADFDIRHLFGLAQRPIDDALLGKRLVSLLQRVEHPAHACTLRG